MSYYYNYYLGYEKDNKIYPLGPFNEEKKLEAVLWRSRNFASNLHHLFNVIKNEQISFELEHSFSYTDWDGEEKIPKIKILPLENLPTGSFIRRGYFLTEDVKNYEHNLKDCDDILDVDGFYDSLEPVVYAQMLQNEVLFGKPSPKKNEWDEEYQPKSASDYMYYAYPDYGSKEYESSVIRMMADVFDPLDEKKIVVLETEG